MATTQKIQFIEYSVEEFKTEVTALFKQDFEKLIKACQPPTANEYLTRQKVAEMLGVNYSTLHNWKHKKILVPFGISGRVYYLRSEVEKALIRLN